MVELTLGPLSPVVHKYHARHSTEVPCRAEKFPAQSATMGRKGNEGQLPTGALETQRKHTHEHTNAHTHVHVHASSIRLHQFHWLYSELAVKSLRKRPFLLSWRS